MKKYTKETKYTKKTKFDRIKYFIFVLICLFILFVTYFVSKEDKVECDMNELKKYIPGQIDSHTMALKDQVAYAKAMFYLAFPFAELPQNIKACESQPYHNIILKQRFLETLLDLKKPEHVVPKLLGSNIKTSIIDIGANVGQTCIPLALEGHTVYSFEPVKNTCETLKNNIKQNNIEHLVNVQCVAIGEREETIYFGYYGKNKPDSASLRQLNIQREDANVVDTVHVSPIHQKISMQNLKKAHIFKTDTQGYEVNVLRGAWELLRSENSPRFLFIEFSCGLLRSVGGLAEPKNLLDIVYEAGYVCTHLVFHHMVQKKPRIWTEVDTPFNMQNTNKASGTFDELISDICEGGNHKWTKNGESLSVDVQQQTGWTDLLCFK